VSGIFGETATGVARGALRDAVSRGQIGADDRVVVLVTGSGLKTPDAVGASTSREIDADVDELLAELEVAA
jgi:threonine synthase